MPDWKHTAIIVAIVFAIDAFIGNPIKKVTGKA